MGWHCAKIQHGISCPLHGFSPRSETFDARVVVVKGQKLTCAMLATGCVEKASAWSSFESLSDGTCLYCNKPKDQHSEQERCP